MLGRKPRERGGPLGVDQGSRAAWRRTLPAGDAAFLLEFGDRIDPDTNEAVHALAAAIRAAGVPGIYEVVPGFASLLVEFDPMAREPEDLLQELAGLPMPSVRGEPRRHVIPVAYGADFGPDLPEVAASLGLAPQDVVRLHTETEYRIYCIGFSPGFPLCGALPPQLRLPRRPSPRTKVAAGSVAIAGGQTGIYPLETAGGWHLIGRTPCRLFYWDQSEPVPFQPGDFIRFRPIDAAEFRALARREAEPGAGVPTEEAGHG